MVPSCKCGSAGLRAACVQTWSKLFLSLVFCLPRNHERFCVAVFACWDVFPNPGTLPEQPTVCITTGNLNCELRFFPSPVRGEGAVRKGRTCILCV